MAGGCEMTTIAYRAGIMAADTRAMNGGWIVSENVSKLVRLDDGAVAGFAADSTAWVLKFTRWYNASLKSIITEREQPDMKDEALVLVAHPEGWLQLYSGTGYSKLSDPFHAIGSGWPAAHAAMWMGASAERAVRVAAKIDPEYQR
jgi:ATP-dependent protease HslVU (ClpYQ) peptidase subunit